MGRGGLEVSSLQLSGACLFSYLAAKTQVWLLREAPRTASLPSSALHRPMCSALCNSMS